MKKHLAAWLVLGLMRWRQDWPVRDNEVTKEAHP